MAASESAIAVAEHIRDAAIEIGRLLTDALEHPPDDVHEPNDLIMFLRLVTVVQATGLEIQSIIDEYTE